MMKPTLVSLFIVALASACGRDGGSTADGGLQQLDTELASVTTFDLTYTANQAKKTTAPLVYRGGYLVATAANGGSAIFQIYFKHATAVALSATGVGPGAIDFGMDDGERQSATFTSAISSTAALAKPLMVSAAGWHNLNVYGHDAGVSLASIHLTLGDVTTPPPPPPPPGNDDGHELAIGEIVNLGGMPFIAQTKDVVVDGSTIDFTASTGDFANFDPTDGRKIRCEVLGLNRFEKGQTFTAEGDLTVRGPATPHTDLQWWSPMQIHAADTRTADGVPYMASPPFALDIQPKGSGYEVIVRAESSPSKTGGFVPTKIVGRMPFEMNRTYHVAIEYKDMHGAPGGVVRVKVDGNYIANEGNIPTGWGFVDNPILLNGKPQLASSYLKIGIYAGNQYRPAPVTLGTHWANLTTSVR